MSAAYNASGVLSFEKHLLEAGCGKYHPNDFCLCTIVVRCQGNCLSENIVDVVGCQLDQEITVIIGHGKTYAGCVIDVCLQTMVVGDKCLIKTNTYCEKSATYCPLELELRLLSFHPELDVHLLSVFCKISRAVVLKEIGAVAFKSGDTRVAFYKFSRSFKYLSCAANIDDDAELISDVDVCVNQSTGNQLERSFSRRDFSELVCQCLLNMAACQLRFENFETAKTNCTRALAVDPANVKGLYRRARCFLQLGEQDLAVDDLKRAVALEPGNQEVLKLLKTAKEVSRKTDETLAKAMEKMFQKI